MGGKWLHRVSEKDLNKKIGICSICGQVKIIKSGNSYKCLNSKRIQSSRAGRINSSYRKILGYKKEFYCELCGIENKDYRFFDVDHKDSNHKNNNDENLQILCPNCHIIKTLKLWDSWKKY